MFAQSLTIQGRLTNSAGQPVSGAATAIRVQILSPAPSGCILYDETQTVDLSQTAGLFSVSLNNGSGTVNAPATYGLERAISNLSGFAVSSAYCQAGSGTVNYSPAATDSRNVVIQFKDPSSMANFETLSAGTLNPGAYAMEARTVGGFSVSSLLRVADSGIPGSPAALTSANFSELQNLINGTSAAYMASSGSSASGARLPTYSGSPSSPATGSVWFDSSSDTMKYFDGTSTQTIGTSSGSGTITGITTSAPLSGSGTSGSVNISLSTSGVTAGTYGSAAAVPVLSVDAFGRVTAASTATISGVAPGGSAGGDLSGSYPAPTVAKIQGTPVSATAPSSGQVMKYNGTNWGGALLSMSDLYAPDSSPVITNAACTGNQTLYLDSVTGHFECQSIGGLNASAIATGTFAGTLMPAFSGDATSSAGSTTLTLAPSGATAGTYKAVTVDGKGRVTAGSNPTTLSGFGITDGVQNTGGLPSMAAGADSSKPSAGTTGRLYVASDTFKIYRDNGTTWDLIASAAGSGGTISNITAGSGLTGGGASGSVTISMPTVGSVGTYTKVVTDAQGRVTSGGTLNSSDLPGLPWSQITSGVPTTLSGFGITNAITNAGGSVSLQAGTFATRPAASTAGRFFVATDTDAIYYDTGSTWNTISSSSTFAGSLSGDVTGTQSATVVSQVAGSTAANVHSAELLANAATNLNTASSIVKRDASGNFAAGAVSVGSDVFRDTAANTATIAAPTTISTSYSLTLPTAAPSANGQLLSATTAGALSWASPSSIYSTSVTAPITNSGTATAPNIGITQATTSASGYLSSTDWNAFNNKLASALNSAMIWVGNASNVPTAITPSGDISVTNAGAFTVTGIKGKAVSAAPTTTGQVLRYDGTNITPNFLSMGDLRSTVTGSSALTVGCTAAQTLTWNAGSDNLMCQNISVAAASQITGTLPVSNGGTGVSSTSQGFVFAGPTGGPGAPSFRALSASDLPASASYWTAATGGINYASGNVGIGNTSPLNLLDVGTTTGGSLHVFGNSAPNVTQQGVYLSWNQMNGSAGETDIINNKGGGTGGFAFQNSTALGSPLMYIASNGNVGVGLTSPASTLDVNGALTVRSNIQGASTASAYSIGTDPSFTAGAFLQMWGSTSAVPNTFLIATAGAERLRVSASGNVGIGTTSPAAALDVVGQSRSVASGGSSYINGSTNVDWNNGNTQAMSSPCTSTSFTNMLDGGTYILAVTDTSATTCVFSQSGLSFLYSPANTSRVSRQQSVYTFQRIGSNVYVSWIAGFQ